MISCYHVDLAAIALALGVVVLVVTMRVPLLDRRSVALAGEVGAVLGSLTTPRDAIWVIAAVLVVAPADRVDRPHPLGRFTLGLAVVALAGIWTAVPDTEPPLAAVLVLLPLALWQLAAARAPGPTGTAALVVAIVGAAWSGSAGWGAAMASIGAVGLIATAPLVTGFTAALGPTRRGLLVGLQLVVGAVMPRVVAFGSVPAAVGIALGVNVVLVSGATHTTQHSGGERRATEQPLGQRGGPTMAQQVQRMAEMLNAWLPTSRFATWMIRPWPN